MRSRIAEKLRLRIHSALTGAFRLVGVEAILTRTGTPSPVITFDKRTLQSFHHSNERTQLYEEALRRSGMEWSDNFAKQCRFHSLQQMASFASLKIPDADFVECGCWKGHSSYMISRILQENRFSGSFHIFDSFEGGLSERTDEDRIDGREQTPEEIAREKAHFSSTEAELKHTVEGFHFVKTYKGWIPERFPEVTDRTFAFVHIDVDLYQPTLDSLEFFYPRLEPGGVIVVDDYGYTQFPGARRAVDEFLRDNDCFLFYETPIGSCFLIK